MGLLVVSFHCAFTLDDIDNKAMSVVISAFIIFIFAGLLDEGNHFYFCYIAIFHYLVW